jgi:large subunit ribosomal protein L15e|tara:strand:- start:1079 stop:1666 length:588 start_codon:yes stop_codon:yes gene_type:complete
MGMYQHVRELWKQPKKNLGDIWKQRLIQWRKEESTVRIPKPTRIDRARSLGYRAKQGILVVRQRVIRGGRQRETIRRGRRSKHFGQRKDLDKNYQQISEERASKKYPNCEVLNSYYVAEDGRYFWYEIILIDRAHPQILADKQLNWISRPQHTGRVFRGLTSSGRKSRGLRSNKGKGAEKLRPSRTANWKRRKQQ